MRELRNAIERAILLCDGGLITREHMPAAAVRSASARPDGRTLDHGAMLSRASVDLGAAGRVLILRALGQANGNKSKAARLLGLSRAQLYSRLEKHYLD